MHCGGFALARAVLETLCIVEDYCRNTEFWPEVYTKEDPLPRPGPFQGFPALMEALP